MYKYINTLLKRKYYRFAITIFSILFFFKLFDKINETYITDGDETIVQIEQLPDPILASIDEECDWVFLEPRTYFKRQASYYFSDASLVSLNYVIMRNHLHLQFSLETLVYNRELDVLIRVAVEKSTSLRIIEDIEDGTFVYFNLVATFNLYKLLWKFNWNLKDIDLFAIVKYTQDLCNYLIYLMEGINLAVNLAQTLTGKSKRVTNLTYLSFENLR